MALIDSRGDWRNKSTSAPTLLTKSCHDIDMLLWLLCSPPPKSTRPAHIPSKITSTGALRYFHKGRKPVAAGNATNCLSCDFEPSCKYSAKKIYVGPRFPGLGSGNIDWPVDVLVPEIEDCIRDGGQDAGTKALLKKLGENYDTSTPTAEISSRPWFGRCVYESDNDVCDHQTVVLTFDDVEGKDGQPGIGGKTATFNMVALTEKVCERYTHIYGTDGEIYADSASVVVQDFSTGKTKTYYPHVGSGGHGAGDGGLARQFVLAIDRVKNHGEKIADAQVAYIGCSAEEVVRSHAVVFAAEEARENQTVVDFPTWWQREVVAALEG